jgi:hypothetical protein
VDEGSAGVPPCAYVTAGAATPGGPVARSGADGGGTAIDGISGTVTDGIGEHDHVQRQSIPEDGGAMPAGGARHDGDESQSHSHSQLRPRVSIAASDGGCDGAAATDVDMVLAAGEDGDGTMPVATLPWVTVPTAPGLITKIWIEMFDGWLCSAPAPPTAVATFSCVASAVASGLATKTSVATFRGDS